MPTQEWTCEICGELLDVFILVDEGDWFTEAYHVKCYKDCHCIVRERVDPNCPVHKENP